MVKSLLRSLPSVDELLRDPEIAPLYSKLSAQIVKDSIRSVLERLREEILSGRLKSLTRSSITARIKEDLEALLSSGLKPVVNASGTVVHTHLGRAPLPEEAVEAVRMAARGPVSLEINLEDGSRGERDSHCEALIVRLTGCEAACIVNNNAAAVFLTLNTLSSGKEAIISRGELIEIGGSFRLPEIMERSGCILKEVGTTNRTHLHDYIDAIGENTGLLLKVHKSNYNITGFTKEVNLAELVAVGRRYGIPVVEDLGSGSLVDLSKYGLKKEPVVDESIKKGADVVTFSADKLLGGPQAGIIAGRKEFVDKIRRNPLKRALRVDKLTLSALEATLRLYLNPEELEKRLPILVYLTRQMKDIEEAAHRIKDFLSSRLGKGFTIEVEQSRSIVGSGALPDCTIPTTVVTVTHPEIRAEKIFNHFLHSDPPVLGRVEREKFVLDARTIDVNDIEHIKPLSNG